jgi:hypothetical protein
MMQIHFWQNYFVLDALSTSVVQQVLRQIY